MTPLLSLLCASLEGEGAEVSVAIPALGMVHGTQTGGCRSGSSQANCSELKHVFKITGTRNFYKREKVPAHPAAIATSFLEVLSETFVI